MSKRERRFLQSDVSVEQGESPKITGYAAVFNSRSFLLGDFVEEVDPGAFTECLESNPDIVGLFNHSNDMVLGRTTSGTMRVSVDTTGLKYEIDPPDTSYAKDLIVSMQRGDIRASSFGFVCHKDSWSYDKKTNQNVRRILKAEIFDCSPVTNPAYGESSSQVRSLFPDDKGHVPAEINEKIAELRNARRKEKRGRNILASVSSSKWAILPEKLETICAFLSAWSDGHTASKDEVQAAMMGQDSVFEAEQTNGVAVIPVYGVINQRMTMMAEFCGGTSTDKLTAQLRAAVADASITAVVLDIDSPGGTVTGVPELAAEIMKLKAEKPIIAVSNGMAASAAYWIAAACTKVVCTPSGEVGSIGVYMTHTDVSQAMDKAGVKISFIQAGKYKTDGNPYEPASESFLADAQAGVDEYYEMFTLDVATGRGVSQEVVKSAAFGQGRMLMAKDAVANGMADSIQTLDEVVSGLLGEQVTVGSVEETVEQPSDNGVEAAVVVALTSGCECNCENCVLGNHAECSGEDDDCDFEFDDDEEDDDSDMISAEVAPVVAAEITPEPLSAEAQHEAEANHNTLTKAKVMRLFS